MNENIYIRIDGNRVRLLDYAIYDTKNKCTLWYIFDSKEPISDKEHKIEIVHDEDEEDEDDD